MLTEQLRRLARSPEDELDLGQAALVIARHEYPQLDIGAYLERLDELARSVRARLASGAGPERKIAVLNRCLYQEQGFRGNAADYYDPRNSFLNEVLDRRLGIPITLAILHIEVGRRLGLPLQGVAFPAHFLVKLALPQGTIVLDPFAGGATLEEQELRRRLVQACGENGARLPLARVLAGASKHEILARMLRNLKAIYLRSGQFSKALAAVEGILVLVPGVPEDIRDRGLIYQKLECAQAALADLERYLASRPQAPDAERIRARLLALRRQAAALH